MSGWQTSFRAGGLNSPHIHSLPEEKIVVEVTDGAIHSVAVSHLHHGRPGLTLHELYLQDEITDRMNRLKVPSTQCCSAPYTQKVPILWFKIMVFSSFSVVFHASKMEQSSILFHKTFSVDKHFVLVKMFLLLKDYFWVLWIIFKSDSDELEDCVNSSLRLNEQ